MKVSIDWEDVLQNDKIWIWILKILLIFFFSEIVAENVGDMFMWMPKEHLCVLVYLITATHSMQGGYLDKAQKYTDKALIQIEKLRSRKVLFNEQ